MYGNGWYHIAYSHELKPGIIKSLFYFGRDLIVFRGEDKKVRVYNAHCPHLGAHLGKGGKVIGNAIRCPFHGWKFCGEGNCIEIPYAKRIPPNAKLHSYPAEEKNGLVFMYYHAENKKPESFIPTVPEYTSAQWTKYKIFKWKFRSRVEEVIENITDLAHFKFIHGTEDVPEAQLEITPDRFHLIHTSNAKLIKKYLPTTMHVNIFSPGYLTARVNQTLDIIIHVSVTPIDSNYVKQHFTIAINKNANPLLRLLLTPIFLYTIRKQFEEDIAIFENRIIPEKLLICDGDALIVRYRKWYSQFYSN